MANIVEAVPGAVFGRLTVVSVYRRAVAMTEGSRNRTCLMAMTRCECGESKEVPIKRLGVYVRSCGCLRSINSGVKKHGGTGTRTYRIWKNMWKRCTNPNDPKYPTYRHRAPPERWKDFNLFLSDMGECPEGLSIDRIDNDKPYGPDNCRWADNAQQQQNTTRTIKIVHKSMGVMAMSEVARKFGYNYGTLRFHLAISKKPIDEVLGSDFSWPSGVSPYA